MGLRMRPVTFEFIEEGGTPVSEYIRHKCRRTEVSMVRLDAVLALTNFASTFFSPSIRRCLTVLIVVGLVTVSSSRADSLTLTPQDKNLMALSHALIFDQFTLG